ncbi:MAG: TrpR-like protein, YerC/YecD [Ruminococcaceae bacterium]|nr:TrpR-like protein, YerC/YecD [Oscillospiraceae bacterium]
MKEIIKDEYLDLLCEAILSLKDSKEVHSFLCDVCSNAELKAITQRLVVAKMLSEDCVYNKIIEETGASTATISRVNKSLEHGADGYKLVLSRLENK